MRAADRRDAILERVLAGTASATVLSEELGVSVSTIRRDLGQLAAAGRIARTYGGAMLAPPALELTLNEKERGFPAEKDAIAAAAAARVGPGETVIVDAGTTTGRLAWHLRDREDLRVVTNGVNTVATLATAEGIELIVLGGYLRPTTQAMVGGMAEDALRQLTVDKAFLGCDGVVAGRGLASPTLAQTHLKRLMLRQADEVFVLADRSKLGEQPFRFWTPLDRDYTLLTDDDATAEQLAPFEADTHARVLVAAADREEG
jgi:DeoR family fructose operon transcriptional repressor